MFDMVDSNEKEMSVLNKTNSMILIKSSNGFNNKRSFLYTLSLLLTVNCFLSLTATITNGAELAKDPMVEFNKLKNDLRANKQSMCSFLLTQVSNEEVKLTIEKVTDLFEQALDHMAKSAEYATIIRPHVDVKVIDEFDINGGNLVLDVSNNRRKVVEEYKAASNKSEEEKKKILEKYFYKACSSKLGTVIAEKSMYDSMLNMEAKLKAKYGIKSDDKL